MSKKKGKGTKSKAAKTARKKTKVKRISVKVAAKTVSQGQGGPRIPLAPEKLNKDESLIWSRLKAKDRLTITEMSELFGPRSPASNSRARNALRRLVRGGFAMKAGRGAYQKGEPYFYNRSALDTEADDTGAPGPTVAVDTHEAPTVESPPATPALVAATTAPPAEASETSDATDSAGSPVESSIEAAEEVAVESNDQDETTDDETTDDETTEEVSFTPDSMAQKAHEFSTADDEDSLEFRNTLFAVAAILLGPERGLSSTAVAKATGLSRGFVIPRIKTSKRLIKRTLELTPDGVSKIREACDRSRLRAAA